MAAQREWFEKDYYEVLGVPESATQKEITRAYRKLARTYHPDANPDDASAEERFKAISAAYDVVGDEARRKEYDEVRRLGPVGFGGTGGPGPGPGGGFTYDFSGSGPQGDLGDLLSNLFGRAGRRAGTEGRGAGPQRGADQEAELHLSFRDAVRGVTTTVTLMSEVSCQTCGGTGSRPGSAPKICSGCHGRGVIDDDQGFFSFSSPCTQCGGKGVLVVDPCEACHGSGAGTRRREVRVRLPEGVADGQRIRLKGRGGPGRNGGPDGDLYVVVHLLADPLFGRRGHDLTLTVPISFPEAALGTDLTVPTIDGERVTLRIPPGTGSGRTFRVRGRGVHTPKQTGDLLVTVEVAVPSELDDDARRAVEALRAVVPDDDLRRHLGV